MKGASGLLHIHCQRLIRDVSGAKIHVQNNPEREREEEGGKTQPV